VLLDAKAGGTSEFRTRQWSADESVVLTTDSAARLPVTTLGDTPQTRDARRPTRWVLRRHERRLLKRPDAHDHRLWSGWAGGGTLEMRHELVGSLSGLPLKEQHLCPGVAQGNLEFGWERLRQVLGRQLAATFDLCREHVRLHQLDPARLMIRMMRR
jgi:hypothetical protein